MADQLSGRPAYNDDGKIILPDLTKLGIKQKSLEAMAEEPINFEANFCLTGTFALGDRSAVAREIESRGGKVVSRVGKTGCTVVLGTAASYGWAGEVWGRKLEDAAEYIREGLPVVIITEDKLAEALLHSAATTQETVTERRERYSRMEADGTLTKAEAALLRKHFG